MKARAFLIGFVLLASGAFPARADIPTIDSAQLDQHTATANTVVKLLPVTTDHAKARSGVRCASTTGQKGAVKNTSGAAQSATGTAAVNSSAPGIPTVQQAGAAGPALAVQYDGSQSAAVVSGIAGGQGAASGANANFAAQGAQAGQSATVMAAWDANTSARAQNGIAYNSVIDAASLIAQAFNLANMATVTEMSQAGGSASYAPSYTAGKCPVGATGQGTAASPCVGVGSTCSATAALCVEQRYVDSYGNVIYYLAMMQTANTAAAAVAAVKK